MARLVFDARDLLIIHGTYMQAYDMEAMALNSVLFSQNACPTKSKDFGLSFYSYLEKDTD